MASYYFDSSALIKRYAQETGSRWVSSLTDPQAGHEIFTALVSGAEIVAAKVPYAAKGLCLVVVGVVGDEEHGLRLGKGYGMIQGVEQVKVQTDR
jgi:hypothetical protein